MCENFAIDLVCRRYHSVALLSRHDTLQEYAVNHEVTDLQRVLPSHNTFDLLIQPAHTTIHAYIWCTDTHDVHPDRRSSASWKEKSIRVGVGTPSALCAVSK